VSLPIQKSATKNCVVADSEINSKTVSLPIQKSAENCIAANSEIDSQLCRCRFLKLAAMVESFRLYFFLSFLCLHY
jgi:hypothetical protein